MPPEVYAFNAFLVAVPGGALFAAAAAWYRRFLNLANPNRGRRPPARRPSNAKSRR